MKGWLPCPPHSPDPPCCTRCPWPCCHPSMSPPTTLRPLCLHRNFAAWIDWEAQAYPDPPLASAGHCAPDSPSPQLSSSDMSLQSGLRSQRYSRATHSLWLWQANSVSVQTLEIWGTVGLEGVREAGGRLVKGQHRHCMAGRGHRCPASGHVVSGRLSEGKEHVVDTSAAHTGRGICDHSLTRP